ncbi:hypothetical protein Cadr_000028179 [Camelus dromedarius]|uniref:Uncharacterized protein n=1 Tax=Camelus dromedarius TaxID=9838 RepID=A0A5N4C8K3_CAMDR|nr:hypothetical protein Cadr_000028179 [Camelus dromedarius]
MSLDSVHFFPPHHFCLVQATIIFQIYLENNKSSRNDINIITTIIIIALITITSITASIFITTISIFMIITIIVIIFPISTHHY